MYLKIYVPVKYEYLSMQNQYIDRDTHLANILYFTKGLTSLRN